MKYIDVQWHHSNAEYPTRLVSELGDDGSEIRKLEFYADGRIGFASKESSRGNTRLSEEPIPSLPDINSQSEFGGEEIAASVFENLWSGNVHAGT